ncbi:MAG: radical SAM protein [Mycobacteriales bacterium]
MRQLSLHLTDLCNSRCSFCVVGSPLVRADSVRWEDVVAFLVDNAGEGYESVNLHGGEPTIHPRLLDVLDMVQALGYPETQIQTNGRRLKDPAFVAELAARGVRLLVISLHGATAGLQDLLTQAAGGFDETIEGIRNAERAGLKVRTNTVVTNQNLGQLADIARLCAELGVDHVNISNLHPVGSGYFALDSMAPTMAELRGHLDPALAVLEDAAVTVTLEGFPLCVVTPYEQLAVEDGTRQIRMLYQGRVFDDYDMFMDRECREHGPPCAPCPLRARCGGVYKEYVERRGWSEFGPRAAAVQ